MSSKQYFAIRLILPVMLLLTFWLVACAPKTSNKASTSDKDQINPTAKATPTVNKAAEPPTKQLLYDFRSDQGVPFDPSSKLSEADERRVLTTLFPKYLTSMEDCRQFDDQVYDNEDAQAEGAIVPNVIGVATGAFTAPAANETAYLVFVGECTAAHADNYGSKRLVIFSGQRLLLNLEANYLSEILRTTDLNQDGQNELLLAGGDIYQGVLLRWAKLVEIKGKRLKVIKDFQQVYQDGCGYGKTENGDDIHASVISYTPVPGQFPKFLIENYRASCDQDDQFTFFSTGTLPPY